MSDEKVIEVKLAVLETSVNEVKTDVRSLQHVCTDIATAQRVNNQILAEHHKRSTNLEDRFVPIEDHVKFIQKSIKLILTLGALAGAVLAMYKLGSI